MVKKEIEEKKLFLFHRFSNWCADNFGKPAFLIVHMLVWAVWMIFATFDPFPFQLLTLVVSLESILLSGIILNATNREGERDRATIEKDLRIDKSSHELIYEMHKELMKSKRTRGGKENGKESKVDSLDINDGQEVKRKYRKKSS
jgi:hypothetical protein